MSDAPAARPRLFARSLPSVDRPVVIAFACLVLLMGLGSLYSKAFLSADFLGQEVQRASYVGVVALGQMTVILLGRIDLSVPWTLTTAAMMATAVGGTAAGAPFAVPAGLAAGLAVGLVNGLGIALLRVPSMIFTLGINSVLFGLMTIYTGGGFAPSDNATPLMSWLGVGRGPLGVPIPVVIWAILAIALSFLLRRTVFGRAVYGIGNSEAAAYLSGIDTRLVVIGAFMLSGFLRRDRGRAARRLCGQGGAGDGRRIPAPVDRGGRAGRHQRTRRARHHARHGRGRAAHHLPGRDAHRGADARGWPPDHLLLRHPWDASHLRAGQAPSRLTSRRSATNVVITGGKPMLRKTLFGTLASALLAGSTLSSAARADTYKPECFKAAAGESKVIKLKSPRPGPYKVALVNGFVANTWRQQMIKTIQAFAAQPDIKSQIKELKIVSVGEDFPAQLAAIEDFINQDYDAILISPESGTGFDRVIREANRKGTVLIAFNGSIQTHDIVQVTQNQVEFGSEWAKFVVAHMPKPEGTILEVAGISGNPADNDRHQGQMDVLKAYPNIKVVTVFGKWDDGTAQRVTADAVAAHGHFDGMIVSGGSTGAVRALMDAKQPFIPVAGEAENGFRKLIAEHGKEGLAGISIGNSPGQSAISLLAAIALLKGEALPATVELPNPTATNDNLKAGDNYYPDLSDNFFTPNQFPPCGVNISGPEIMAQPEPKASK